jgi:hypothetical protein
MPATDSQVLLSVPLPRSTMTCLMWMRPCLLTTCDATWPSQPPVDPIRPQNSARIHCRWTKGTIVYATSCVDQGHMVMRSAHD